MKKNVFVGVDPSLRGTGVAAYQPGIVGAFSERIGSDLTEWPAKDIGTRFALFNHNVSRLVSFLERYEPCIVVFEQSYESRMSNGVVLIENATLMKAACFPWATVIEIPPTSLRKFIGDHKMAKDMMPVKIGNRWGVQFPSHDEYVAYALARVGECFCDESKCETAAQREVVAKLKSVKVSKKRKSKA